MTQNTAAVTQSRSEECSSTTRMVAVTITDNNGCELLLEFDIALNLFSYEVEGLIIYPNPVTSILYIDGADNLAPYRILGMDGKTVVQGELEYGHLDLSELPAGVYHFQLYHNQHWTTSQIFKQ